MKWTVPLVTVCAVTLLPMGATAQWSIKEVKGAGVRRFPPGPVSPGSPIGASHFFLPIETLIHLTASNEYGNVTVVLGHKSSDLGDLPAGLYAIDGEHRLNVHSGLAVVKGRDVRLGTGQGMHFNTFSEVAVIALADSTLPHTDTAVADRALPDSILALTYSATNKRCVYLHEGERVEFTGRPGQAPMKVGDLVSLDRTTVTPVDSANTDAEDQCGMSFARFPSLIRSRLNQFKPFYTKPSFYLPAVALAGGAALVFTTVIGGESPPGMSDQKGTVTIPIPGRN